MELISRKNVLNYLQRGIDFWYDEDEKAHEALKTMKFGIEAMPTIESRPTGTWETHKRAVLYKGAKKYVAEFYHECSNCKQEAEIVQDGCWLHSKFCPNCGAKMLNPEEKEND